MKIDENIKQRLAGALRKKAQPMAYDQRYASADEAIRAHAREALAQIYGPETIYGEDDCWEQHPYFCNRSARDWTWE